MESNRIARRAEADQVVKAGKKSSSEAAPMTIDDAIDFSNVPPAEDEPSQPNAAVQGEQEEYAGGDYDDEAYE